MCSGGVSLGFGAQNVEDLQRVSISISGRVPNTGHGGCFNFHKILLVNLRVLFFSIDETLLASRHVCYEHVHLMSLVVYASFTWYEGVVYPSCTGSVHVAISHEGKTLWQSGSLLWSRKLWAKLRNSIEPAFWFQGRTLTFWSFLNKKLWKASHTGSSQDSTRRVALHFASNLQAKNTLYLFVEQKWNVSKMFTLKDLTCLLLNDKWFHCTVLKTLLSLFWPWQKK